MFEIRLVSVDADWAFQCDSRWLTAAPELFFLAVAPELVFFCSLFVNNHGYGALLTIFQVLALHILHRRITVTTKNLLTFPFLMRI